ncbi:MAG: serine/threonine protein kinase [Myxococcaceae bacterium]|nr:serine/threonine protein kinase [Myxococcaceae bacterium]
MQDPRPSTPFAVPPAPPLEAYDDASNEWAPGQHIGGFALVRTLAKGGMGEVWLARRNHGLPLREEVVLKRVLMATEQEEELVESLKDEARILAQLSHPGIVRVFALEEHDDTYFLVLEYLHGHTLGQVLSRLRKMKRAFPRAFAVYLLALAARGLGYAHRKCADDGRPLHIVHRDVSPQNLFLTFGGEIKLIDFGIAKTAALASRTRAGTLKGKLTYMAPEQCIGRKVDARADVFSMGVVLFEALSATRFHFDKDDAQVLLTLRDNFEAPDVRTRNGDISADLAAVVSRALMTSPTERFADGEELAAALFDWLSSQRAVIAPADIAVLMHEVYSSELAMHIGPEDETDLFSLPVVQHTQTLESIPAALSRDIVVIERPGVPTKHSEPLTPMTRATPYQRR